MHRILCFKGFIIPEGVLSPNVLLLGLFLDRGNLVHLRLLPRADSTLAILAFVFSIVLSIPIIVVMIVVVLVPLRHVVVRDDPVPGHVLSLSLLQVFLSLIFGL